MVDAGLVESYVAKISPSLKIHNHRIHSANKIAQCVREKINNAVLANPAFNIRYKLWKRFGVHFYSC